MEEKERKKAEVRKRLEEASKAKKGGGEKKGFMTPERKKKLRVSRTCRKQFRHAKCCLTERRRDTKPTDPLIFVGKIREFGRKNIYLFFSLFDAFFDVDSGFAA